MAGETPNLRADGVILRNLKGAMYKMGLQPMEMRVTSATSVGTLVFLGTIGQGCHVYDCKKDSKIEPVTTIGRQADTKRKKEGCNCYDVTASESSLVYLKEEDGSCSVCIHNMADVLDRKTEPARTLQLKRRAPMIYEPHLEMIVLGGVAWSSSWTGGNGNKGHADKNLLPDCEDSFLRALDTKSFTVQKEWQATDNSVSLLRSQWTPSHSMLGVSDSRTGLKVYDLRKPTDDSYHCLYQVPVDEVRNFQLVGNFVAVFHKFEPNVSFWNMKEQKTILCINIQDQMRELAEEFLEDEDDDCGLFGDDDDHVTAVTCVPSDDDHLLMYGTKSGCVFGMSVLKRSKLFNIPCPHDLNEDGSTGRRDVQGICFVPEGKIVCAYERHGLTVLDFSPENPPDRPPTRCQKRQ